MKRLTQSIKESVLYEFYDFLNQLYSSAPNHDVKTILEDLSKWKIRQIRIRKTDSSESDLINFETGYNLVVKSSLFASKTPQDNMEIKRWKNK